MRFYDLECVCLEAYLLVLPKAIKEREEQYYFWAQAAPEYYRPIWKRLGEYATHLKQGKKPSDFVHYPFTKAVVNTDVS